MRARTHEPRWRCPDLSEALERGGFEGRWRRGYVGTERCLGGGERDLWRIRASYGGIRRDCEKRLA
eukprot:3506098-Pleurochrysis_carterae.AAC.1